MTTATAPGRLRGHSLAAPALAMVVLGVLATTVGPTSNASITDLGIFVDKAEGLREGLWPYREIELEYPPLSLVVMWVPSLFGDYDLAFGLEMLIAGLAVLWATWRIAPAAAWPLAVAGPLAAGAMLRTHYDLVPTALALGGLAGLVRGRARLGFGLLAAGAMTKFWPALLLPLAAAWLWPAGRRAVVQGLALAAGIILLVSAPFVADDYARLVTFHLDRPVQIESAPASVLLAVGGSTVTGVPENPDAFKSQGLRGGGAGTVAALFLAVQIAVLAWCLVRARFAGSPRTFVMTCFAALLAFVALGKVLSPQYVIWLLPFGALAWAWRERAVALLTLLAVVLTQVEFPARYWDLVAAEPGPIALTAARNAALLAALTLLLATLGAPARWRRPVVGATPG